MRACQPSADGLVERGGVKIHYEVYGEGGPTILLLPAWTLIHKRFWKLQVPYLSRHYRVVCYDGPGNGRSDRPLTTGPYEHQAQVGYALAVLDATGTERAVVVGLSRAASWALELAAEHPSRVSGLIVIDPALRPPAGASALDTATPDLEPSRVPFGGTDPPEHWAKYTRQYWLDHLEDFSWFFFGQCFSEPHSTKPIEDCVGYARDTDGAVLVADSRRLPPAMQLVEDWCARISCPLLAIHGTDDHIQPAQNSEILAELTEGSLVLLEGSGHIPPARDPVRVNLLIKQLFVEQITGTPMRSTTWTRAWSRPRRVLYLSSPIGLGHARRDVAIANELRRLHPELEIDWLAQHPVTTVLEAEEERIHPASRWLASESAHVTSEAGGHDLHCFQALRRMDEILLANFMVFQEVVEERCYDLVIGDEAWDVDYYWHENPELKRGQQVWLTDFVGFLPMPDGGPREAFLTTDYNAEMIEHIDRYPWIRDRAIFVGNQQDIVTDTFGEGLPAIRDWASEHFTFAGYVTGFTPPLADELPELRARLGYHADELVCIVAVGGSGIGRALIEKVVAAYPPAKKKVPTLRMVVVTGPRIDPASFPERDGLELHGYVHRLYQHLSVCDLAVVQGGLTTTMELAAARRPFLYFPLAHHFEQNFHVAHRLERYRAGRRMDYATTDPDTIARAIAAEIGRPVDYLPVETDGASRAARLIAEIL